MILVKLGISEYRKRFYIAAGGSRLSKGYKNKIEAQKELDDKRSLYEYWSKSISVSVENSIPEVRYIS